MAPPSREREAYGHDVRDDGVVKRVEQHTRNGGDDDQDPLRDGGDTSVSFGDPAMGGSTKSRNVRISRELPLAMGQSRVQPTCPLPSPLAFHRSHDLNARGIAGRDPDPGDGT